MNKCFAYSIVWWFLWRKALWGLSPLSHGPDGTIHFQSIINRESIVCRMPRMCAAVLIANQTANCSRRLWSTTEFVMCSCHCAERSSEVLYWLFFLSCFRTIVRPEPDTSFYAFVKFVFPTNFLGFGAVYVVCYRSGIASRRFTFALSIICNIWHLLRETNCPRNKTMNLLRQTRNYRRNAIENLLCQTENFLRETEYRSNCDWKSASADCKLPSGNWI